MKQPIPTHPDHHVPVMAGIDTSVRFYRDIPGTTHGRFVVPEDTRRHALRLGSQKVDLHQAGAEFDPQAHGPKPGPADLCFLTALRLRTGKPVPARPGPSFRFMSAIPTAL